MDFYGMQALIVRTTAESGDGIVRFRPRLPQDSFRLGSPKAGSKAAAILSIVESCRRIKIPVRDCLAAVLPSLADISIQRLADLTPTA